MFDLLGFCYEHGDVIEAVLEWVSTPVAGDFLVRIRASSLVLEKAARPARQLSFSTRNHGMIGHFLAQPQQRHVDGISTISIHRTSPSGPFTLTTTILTCPFHLPSKKSKMSNKENFPPHHQFLSPNNKPSLTRQRDHSACRQQHRPETPLRIRKTRENLKDPPPPALRSDVVPPPCMCSRDDASSLQNDLPSAREKHHRLVSPDEAAVAKLQRRPSVGRRVLSRVRHGIQGIRPTESETSLIRRLSARRNPSLEIERRFPSLETARWSVDGECSLAGSTTIGNDAGDLRRRRSVTLPSPSPRVDTKKDDSSSVPPVLNLVVPCMHLDVTMDCSSVDASSSQDVWVAVRAVVGTKSSTICSGDRSDSDDGPKYECGTITSLRICYKPVAGSRIREIIGQKALKDLSLGQTCSLFVKLHLSRLQQHVRRDADPDSLFAELESLVGSLETDVLHLELRYRHSLLPAENVVAVRHVCRVRRPNSASRWSVAIDDSTTEEPRVRLRLAEYLALHHSPDYAREFLRRHFGEEHIRPVVVVTDGDGSGSLPSDDDHDDSCPAPSIVHPRETDSPFPLAPKTITAPTTSPPPSPHDPSEAAAARDSARQLWHHIRRSSLSAAQLAELQTFHPGVIADENGDTLRSLREQALRNKRSVGAETLLSWRWEEKMEKQQQQRGEMPWL